MLEGSKCWSNDYARYGHQQSYLHMALQKASRDLGSSWGGEGWGGRNCAFLVCLNYFFERNQIKTITLIMKVKNVVCNFWR